jgi:hypothetical protein
VVIVITAITPDPHHHEASRPGEQRFDLADDRGDARRHAAILCQRTWWIAGRRLASEPGLNASRFHLSSSSGLTATSARLSCGFRSAVVHAECSTHSSRLL